ncbi:MAG: radical SAM protein [Gemmataceae bacterium]
MSTHQPSPRYVQIEPVGQCNLRCQMCPIQFRQDGPPHGPPAFMKFEVFTSIIDQLHELNELHLQGLGEPMMHPRFADMVAYAVRKGVKVSTNSNLTLLNPDRAERCITSGLDCIHVSIDAASAEIYERIRVRARLDRVLRNVELLLAARKRLGSEHPRLKLVMVVMRQNLSELPEVVRLAHRYAMDSVFVQHLCHDFGESSLPAHYQPMRDFVQAETLLEADPACVEQYFTEAKQVAEKLGLELRLPRTHKRLHAPGTPGPKRCDWPWNGPYFSYQGLAMPCCMIATPDRLNFGQIEPDNFQSIWNGEGYQGFRRQLASDVAPAICQSCSVYTGTF